MSEASSVLIVHSRRIRDCSSIKKQLEKCGISSVVVPAKRRIDCSTGDCYSEMGCYISVKDIEKDDVKTRVWDPLNKNFNFTYTKIFHRKYVKLLNPGVFPVTQGASYAARDGGG